jgi:hypothetical protein
MSKPAKLITTTGLALMVALSACGNGDGSGSGTTGGKTSAVAEPAVPGASSNPAKGNVASEGAPTEAQKKKAATRKSAGQKEKTQAHPGKTSTTEAGAVPERPGPDTRQECIDYVNSLVIPEDSRKQVLANCKNYPR